MKIIYWAIKLDIPSKVALLSAYPPKHPKVFAEHMTIAFSPSDVLIERMEKICGHKREIKITGHAEDEYGQAVVVNSEVPGRLDEGLAHVTISCADGVGPVYSNKLLKQGYKKTPESRIYLSGIISKFTDDGWSTCRE